MIDTPTTEKLIHAFVTSRLDYCNSLMHGIHDYQLKKLQSVQNAAARLVTRTKKCDHISPVLFKLHWLPVKERIKFKIVFLLFKILRSECPQYMESLVDINIPGRTLRSSNKIFLTRLDTRGTTINYGYRAFSVAAPLLWNELSFDAHCLSWSCETFKRHLKTHLFNQCYSTYL